MDVPHRTFLLIAAADKQERAGDFLLIGGEILAAKQGAVGKLQGIVAKVFGNCRSGDGIGVGMIIANGITLLPADLRACAVGTHYAFNNALHQLRHLFAHLLVMGTHGARQTGAVRDNVIAVTCLEGGNGQYRGVDRVEITRHHVLQGGDHFGTDHHRVDTKLRHRAVAALTINGDIEVVAGGDIHPFFQRDFAGRAGREHVQAKDLLHIIDHTFFDQLTRAARWHFFGWLEDKLNAAVQLAAQMAQDLRRAHQHRGVRIVAAGVHHAGSG